MVSVHNVVGTLVVVAYLALAIVNAFRVRDRALSWARPIAIAAAGLLLVQYVIGLSLIGGGDRNRTSHYVFALLAIVTVGLEQGYAPTRLTPRARATAALAATLATFVLVLVAYWIGIG